MRAEHPIPAALNVTLAFVAGGIAVFLLFLAARATGPVQLLACALAFSFVNNTLFSLLHEAVHGVFHPHARVNRIFGILLAAFFPTSFTMQRISHLGHHRRNRTDEELFDYYLPGESRFLKTYRLYSLLSGFYWMSIPTGGLLYLAIWNFPRNRWIHRLTEPMGLRPMVQGLAKASPLRIRLELGYAFSFQFLLAFLLGLEFLTWLVCYWAFALNWSSLQYTDHAWTVRDIKNGASNLRVNPLVRALFLNYHHHLAHHQHPNIPWIHLPGFVSESAPRPSFLATYLSLWAGPRPTTAPGPGPMDASLEELLSRPTE